MGTSDGEQPRTTSLPMRRVVTELGRKDAGIAAASVASGVNGARSIKLVGVVSLRQLSRLSGLSRKNSGKFST